MDVPNEEILTKYPHFIAFPYQKLLQAETPQTQIEAALHVYEVGTRALALFLISQYLIQDKDTIKSDPFSALLADSLVYATFGTWTQVFFAAMEAYKDHPHLLFMPELHELYWQRQQNDYRTKPEIRKPFEKMIEIWADLRPQSLAYPKSDKGWKELSNEAIEAVKQFLNQFSFIENYRVIRIVGEDEAGYLYDNLTGLRVGQTTERILTNQFLKVEWYYLFNLKTQKFFHLHPLLILLSNLPSSVEYYSENLGFFDHLDKEASYYWEPNTAQIVKNPELMESVLDWIYFAIERYKAYRREISQLDWEILQEVCQAISADSMGASQSKYQKELYLQRNEVIDALKSFLESDKTCFILTGKSGVGKTNFVLSLLDKYQAEVSDLCFLVYNGAFLGVDKDIKEEISSQFNQRLKFRGREEQAQITDFLWEIDRIPGIKKRNFVLIVDAINENNQPAQLLKSIDQMIRSVGTAQHWLKVIITSRPEAWRRIYRQAKPLAENRYYRLQGQRELEVEMPQFQIVGDLDQASRLAYKMTRFRKDEVKAAYEKYQSQFRLMTDCDKIRPALRKELRDPLIMRLIAEMYIGKAIPTTIRINDIYENYVKALISSERLHPEDEDFLQLEIIPLMAEEGYSNEVTAEQINSHGLRPQILGTEIDSSGRAVNQSFQNLSDADILTRHISQLDYVIRFTFERFYDYYFGQYLYEQVKNDSTPELQYLKWIEAIQTSPYLWGAIKQTLLTHLHNLSKKDLATAQHLIKLMAFGATQPVKELLVRTLADYHRDEAKVVLNWITNLFRADPVDRDEITIPQRIAIEVAAQTENISILEEAAKVKSEPIRAIAVQHIYYLWRQNPETGFALLDNLSKEVKGRWLLPRNEILQSCLALSLTILFNHYKQPDTVYTLQKIWRRILDDVFLINPKQFGSWQETLKAKIRELLLVGVTKFILRNLAQLPKEQTLGIADIQHFWQGPDREKRFVLFKELTKVLDLETCNTKEMHQALMQAVENRDMFCTYLTLIAMTTSLLERPDETLPVIREFFEAGQQIKPAPPAFGYTPWVLAVTMDRQKKINPKFWEMFEDMVEHILNTTEGIWYSAENMYRFMYLHSHDRLNDRMLDDELPSQLARNFLDKKIKEKDFNLLKDYIDRELTYSNSIQLIVAALKFILSYNIKDAQVTESIAKLLRRGRIYYPEEVEDFLSEADVPLEIRNEVQMQGTSERLHDLWSYQALTFFEDTILFSRKSNSARTLYWLFNRATECRDLSEWLILFFKGVINLLYGGPVFPDIKFESSNH